MLLREPRGGQCVSFEARRPWDRPVSLARVPGYGRISSCVTTVSLSGNKSPQSLQQLSYLLPWLMSFNH